MIINAALSALLNLVILAGFPLLGYLVYQRWRRQRGFREIMQRAGLQLGERRFIGYSLVFTLAGVAIIVLWPPPVDSLTKEGSAQRAFVGLGLNSPAIALALLYGMVKTGFTEELLFRGLIAGSLSRRLSVAWANVVQAILFLLPHLFVLWIMPEMWGILPVVFLGALLAGWIRIKSGSIFGPWLMHGVLNVATCLSVAIRSAA